jgi:branched-chain amino acid transport system permease protein
MHWNIFAQQIVFGFVNNIGYALVAIGLTLIFGIMNVTNFAHGEFYMLGSFLISLLSKLAFLKSLIWTA